MTKIGIDFGTTNSLMVAYDKRKNMFTYFSYDGERPMPISSTVWYHDNSINVGSEAREKIYRYSEISGHHFEKSIKLKLGTEYIANIFGQSVAPSSVAAEILKHIKTVAIEDYKADKVVDDLRRALLLFQLIFQVKPVKIEERRQMRQE